MNAVTIDEAKDLIRNNIDNSNFVIIDVRTKEEYDDGHIEKAINISLDRIEMEIGNLDKTKKYLLYCRTQGRSQFANHILEMNGFDTRFMLGGYMRWKNSKVV